MPPLVLNWGRSEGLPDDLIALNRPSAVRIASDQVESIRRLAELAPRTVLRPQDMQLLGSERVVAKRRQGARGSGKAVIAADAAWGERVHHDLFQEFIPDRDEFRVSVLNGRVVSPYAKRTPAGTDPENLRPAWSHDGDDDGPQQRPYKNCIQDRWNADGATFRSDDEERSPGWAREKNTRATKLATG
jgi:hypothetical protein